ncbi:conjugative transposon TraJ protein [Chitinophaga terrae (ex Kim and Jung 2007)]|nr:conjugative transposon TraJ protein [Chitinophaga terrae (ex Kim and Jung 2007)]
MIPLCEKLISVGRGIAGFAALWYISARVWRSLANNEPVDVYPLLRPFAIGIAVFLFTDVVQLMNAVLEPTVTATDEMVKDSNKAIAQLLKDKEDAIKQSDEWKMFVGDNGTGDQEKWYLYTHKDDPNHTKEDFIDAIGNSMKFTWEKMSYNFRNSIKQWLSEVLSVLYAAAALCINTIRTFNLIVLVILGPLVFAFSVFDGFQHTLANWLGRYINIFLWLPCCNIFGAIISKIQENMLKIDISQIKQYGDSFFSQTDTGYLVFMLIAIVGYATIPSVAGYIVQATGANAALQKITSMATTVATGGASRISRGADNLADAGKYFNEGYSGKKTGSGLAGAVGRSAGEAGASLYDKIAGGEKK